MKHTQEEIINALCIIKDECDSHCRVFTGHTGVKGRRCRIECPFSRAKDGLCLFEEQRPINWNINLFNLYWKAFRED